MTKIVSLGPSLDLIFIKCIKYDVSVTFVLFIFTVSKELKEQNLSIFQGIFDVLVCLKFS